MRRFLAAVAALVALAAVAAPVAGAATPTEKKLATLQKQVTALTKQVKFLRAELDANYNGDACLAASTADAFQQTWLFAGTFPPTSTGPAVTEKDYSCANIRVTRQLPTAGRAPTVSAFQAILSWIG
ncbi:MAG: hypothetical protein QOG29_1391 [Gaiellaceae bacterium]|nr:hypothetical protein [Gaiellaceae bacterium]